MFKRKYLIYAAIYSCILPLASTFDIPVISFLGLIISLPFTTFAIIGGSYFSEWFSFSYAYPVGMAVGIFASILVLFCFIKLLIVVQKHLTSIFKPDY